MRHRWTGKIPDGNQVHGAAAAAVINPVLWPRSRDLRHYASAGRSADNAPHAAACALPTEGFAQVTKILARLFFYYLVLASEYLIFAHPGVVQHKPDAIVDRPVWTGSQRL